MSFPAVDGCKPLSALGPGGPGVHDRGVPGAAVGAIRKIQMSQAMWLTMRAGMGIPAGARSFGLGRSRRRSGSAARERAPRVSPVAVIRCQNFDLGPRKVAAKAA